MADLAAGSRLGNYEILKLLGRGGMGEVYLARDLRLDRTVALKILPHELATDPTRLERFNREAKAAASLNHPNICTIHEVGSDNGRSFISMEYVEGVTLHDRIARSAMEIPEVIDFSIQIADALEEARKKNIVHRDIKSTNILVTERNQVKLLDFGLAKHVITDPQQIREASTESHLTESGVVLGTVVYMSPEQALGKAIDHRSDLFSFGVVLYEMLTRSLPFSGNTTAELLDAILHKMPDSVARYNRSVPDELIRIVDKLLEKNPEDRYQSAREVWTDLRRLRTGTSRVVAEKAKVRRKPLLSVAIAVVVVVASAALWFFQSQRNPKETATQVASLVALPCKVYGQPDLSYLSDAIPSTLSTHLATIQDMDTKIPPSGVEVEKFRGDLNKIARSYHVNALVVSSIFTSANRFVLTVQLVDAGSKRVLWSKEYEGTRDGYIELTRKAADGIRQAVRPSSTPVQSAATSAAGSEAELAFLRGRYHSSRYNHGGHDPKEFDQALSAFHRALELDDRFADAAAEIAFLHGVKIEAGEPATNLVPIAESWIQRALRIDSKCSLAWSLLSEGELLKPPGNYRKSLEYALKGASYGPRNPVSQLILAYRFAPSLSLALKTLSHVTSLDPIYLYPKFGLANVLFDMNRTGEALSLADEILDLEPELVHAIHLKTLCLIELGRLSEANTTLNHLQKLTERRRGPVLFLYTAQHAYYLRKGDREKVDDALKKIREMLRNATAVEHTTAVELTVPNLIQEGRTEEALDLLERSYAGGAVFYDFLLLNPQLQKLRTNPRFTKTLTIARVKFDEMMEVIEEARARGEFPPYLEEPLADVLKQMRVQQ